MVDYLTLVAAALRTVFTAPWPQNARHCQMLLLFVCVWPPLKVVTAICMALDHLLYPGFRKVKVTEPLFIVGNLRTGSTLLYRTLARDEQAYSCHRLVDMYLPAVTMKRAAAVLGRVDAALGGHGVRWLERAERRLFRAHSRIHETGWFKPEEDDFLLFNYLCAASMFELFPHVRRFRRFLFLDREMAAPERRRVMSCYYGLVQRQLYHQGAHKRFVSKNPLFTTRLQALAATFPDARFVCLVRNPANTVASTASLLHSIWYATGALPPGRRNTEQVLEFCRAFYAYPEEVLRPMGDRACFVVYDRLVADPARTIRELLAGLALPVPVSLEGVLAQANARQACWRNPHHYDTGTWGLTEEEIRLLFGAVYARYAFPEPGATIG